MRRSKRDFEPRHVHRPVPVSAPSWWPGTALAMALLATLPAMTPAWAATARYALDPVHTRVVFAVSHAGFSEAIGTISGSTGTLLFDGADWATATLQVQVPLARLALGDDEWNRAALAANLLDARAHPLATFVSTRVEAIDPTHASVYGTLTLHGVAREVKLDVRLNALKRHPLPPFRRTAGFSATAAISRKAFGIDAWPGVIGDRVELRIEAEATRTHAASAADGEQDAAAPIPAESGP